MPHIIDWDQFASLLAKYAKSSAVRPHDVLLSGGLDMPSIAFVEFIMEIEYLTGLDIDVQTLDEHTKTAGQLYARLFGISVL